MRRTKRAIKAGMVIGGTALTLGALSAAASSLPNNAGQGFNQLASGFTSMMPVAGATLGAAMALDAVDSLQGKNGIIQMYAKGKDYGRRRRY